MKIYGPYKRKDGRKHIIIYDFDNNIRKTISYPKFVMERYLGRKLEENETVDHIDGNINNNKLSNLQILTRGDNIRKSCYKRKKYYFYCPICNSRFYKYLTPNGYKHISDKHGPYCSKSCAGKGSHIKW